MSNLNMSIAKELYDTLKSAEKEVGIKEIEPNEEKIRAFCKLIDDDNPLYFDNHIFPPGYIMNLSNIVLTPIILKTVPLLQSKISGYIHVNSEVEFIKTMPMKKTYKIEIVSSEPVEKEGKKANYLSVIFKTTISDKNNEIYAIDNHHFFFRL
jgi:hypothetical protein